MRKMRRLTLGVLLREPDPFFADVPINIPVGTVRAFEYQSGSVPTIHIEVADDAMETRVFYLRRLNAGVPEDGEFVGQYTWGQAPVYLFLKRRQEQPQAAQDPASATIGGETAETTHA